MLTVALAYINGLFGCGYSYLFIPTVILDLILIEGGLSIVSDVVEYWWED